MTYISDRGPYMPILKDKLLNKIAISNYTFVDFCGYMNLL